MPPEAREMPAELPVEDLGGRRVAVKMAADAVSAARLLREAEILRSGAHPGVVDLVSVDSDGLWPVVRTAHVEGATLAAATLTLAERAGVVAALAATLADLHDLGLVHGAVAPEHVLVEGDGRPVLCGFGSGGQVGEVPVSEPVVPAPFRDPAFGAHDPLVPAIDVHALGALLAEGLAPSERGAAPVLAIADSARHPDPALRPDARTVAARLHDAVPRACLPRPAPVPDPAPAAGHDPEPARARALALHDWRGRRLVPPTGAGRRPSHPRRGARGPVAGAARSRGSRRRVVAAAGVLALTGVAVATLAVRLAAGPAAPPPAAAGEPDRPAGPATTTGVATTGVATTGVATPPAGDDRPDAVAGCPPVQALLVADVDGDGCADELRFAGGVLESGARRWEVGAPGDVAALGDWSCTGTRTLALLRPATGEVYRFDRWAVAGHDVVAPVLARIDGGRALRVADLDRDGCHELVVERGGGPPAVLRSGPGAA